MNMENLGVVLQNLPLFIAYPLPNWRQREGGECSQLQKKRYGRKVGNFKCIGKRLNFESATSFTATL